MTWTPYSLWRAHILGEAKRDAQRERDKRAVQFANRIPRDLQRRVKLFCIEHKISMTTFVNEALQDAIAKRKEFIKAYKKEKAQAR